MPRLRPEGAGRRSARYLASTAVALGLLLAAPAAAQAVALYVDDSGSDPTNNCQTAATPCATIPQAAGQPGAANVIHVGGGTYTATVTLDNNESLIEDQTFIAAAAGEAVINNSPTAAAAVTIAPSGGSVDGFEIRSAHMPLQVSGPGSVTRNAFPTTTAPTFNQDINVTSGVAGNLLIDGNNFTDDGIGAQFGIFSAATSATNLTIQDNDFSGLSTAIHLNDGDASPLIADNTIAGIHDDGSGVLVFEGSPVIRNNTMDTPGAGFSTGVSLRDTNGPAGGTLSRNTITGLTSGVSIGDTPLPVTLNSDLITGNAGHGLQANAFGGEADFSATNVTIYGSGLADIRLEDNVMTLDSSIVGNAISANGTATCLIDFSRGPTLIGPANGCGSFQTTADPMFVTPGTNYHLQAGSPMIDAGNTLAPPPGTLDIDGNPRALSSTPACTLMAGRRDIGADEFVPATGVGCPLPPVLTPTPTVTPTPKKKCKKGRKLKKGKCVKKKRRRR
jgi:hypothetical protein